MFRFSSSSLALRKAKTHVAFPQLIQNAQKQFSQSSSSSPSSLDDDASKTIFQPLISGASAIIINNEKQEEKKLEEQIKSIMMKTTQQQNENENDTIVDIQTKMNKTILTANQRLRKNAFQKQTQRSILSYDDARCEVESIEYETMEYISPPSETMENRFERGFIKAVGSPSSQYHLDSVLLYCRYGGMKGLMKEKERLLDVEQENNVDDDDDLESMITNIDFALTYPHVEQGWQPSHKNSDGKSSTSSSPKTIFVTDLDNGALELSFVAAIKDSVEFASTRLKNDPVTVVVTATRYFLIDLLQSHEFQRRKSSWIYGENVTLILVPSFAYYGIIYMMKQLQAINNNNKNNTGDNNTNNNFYHVIQKSTSTREYNGTKNAFPRCDSSSTSKNNVFAYEVWGRKDTIMKNQNYQIDASPPPSSMLDDDEDNEKNQQKQPPDSSVKKAFTARATEEKFTDFSIKIMMTSRRLLWANLEEFFNGK